MGYRSEDSSRSRAGSGRQPVRPSSTGYGGPDAYSTPDYQDREEQARYGRQPLSAPAYPEQGYAEPRYDSGGYDRSGYDAPRQDTDPYGTGRYNSSRYDSGGYDSGGYDTGRQGTGRQEVDRYATGGYDADRHNTGRHNSERHNTERHNTGRPDTGRYDTGGGAANDWYSGDHGTGNLTDPYGAPGSQVSRDPVRGYPPAPELYPADGYQRFEADQYGPYAARGTEQRYHDAPVYSDPAYDDRVAYDGPSYGGTGSYPAAYDDDAYERAFSGAGYPDAPYDDDETDEASFRDGPEPPGRKPGRRKNDGGGSRRPSRLLSKTTLLSVSAGIVAIAVAVASYMLLTKPNPAANTTMGAGQATRSQAPAPTPSASAAACASALGTYCHIETRTSDPQPLTLAEVFPAQFMNRSDGSSFAEAGQRTDKSCSNAIIGSNLQGAVKDGKCTQVLRASYVSGNGQIMGTIGVVNLATTTAAAKAGKAVDANDFISPLSTSKGVTKKLGQGTGVVEAEYKGHYLILMWAEYTNLKTPSSSSQKNVLETFEQDLMSGTVNIALSERMVTGKPATTS